MMYLCSGLMAPLAVCAGFRGKHVASSVLPSKPTFTVSIKGACVGTLSLAAVSSSAPPNGAPKAAANQCTGCAKQLCLCVWCKAPGRGTHKRSGSHMFADEFWTSDLR